MSANAQGVASGYTLPNYEPVIPPAVHSGEPEELSVVIIGGGLTGLTAAADFSRRGIPVVVLDDDTTVGVRGASSRGMVYAQKSLEIMDRIGVFHRMLEKGVTWSVGRTMAGRDEVYSFDRGASNVSVQPAFVNLQQFYLEWFLVDRIEELGQAELRWANKVLKVENAEDHALIEVDTPEGGYRIRARWVIDASGVASVSRNSLNIPTHPVQTADCWCICDVRFHRPMPTERWTYVEAPFNGNRAVWQHPMADNVWRLDYQMGADKDAKEAARPEVARERVREHLGPDVDFELVWVGPWQYRTQVLDEFRHGRVFFAGDAAHVMSPFGGRGGNSGIQDAENLTWKLTMVMLGKAPESLLDSYSDERREAALENIAVTSRTARFLAPQSDRERRLRAVVLELARQYAFARPLVNTGQLSEPNVYTASRAVSADGGFCLPNLRLGHDGHSLPLMSLMRDLNNRLLALCVAGPEDVDTDVVQEDDALAVRVLGGRNPDLIDPTGQLLALTGAQPGDVLVIRPDLYLAGRAPGADSRKVADLVARAKGELQ